MVLYCFKGRVTAVGFKDASCTNPELPKDVSTSPTQLPLQSHNRLSSVFWKEPGSTNEQHTVLKFGSNGCLAERAVSEYFRATSLVRNVYAIAMEHAATLALLW